MKPSEEIYYTEIGVDLFKVLVIDLLARTYKILEQKEANIDKDAIFVSPDTLEAMILGFKQLY